MKKLLLYTFLIINTGLVAQHIPTPKATGKFIKANDPNESIHSLLFDTIWTYRDCYLCQFMTFLNDGFNRLAGRCQ